MDKEKKWFFQKFLLRFSFDTGQNRQVVKIGSEIALFSIILIAPINKQGKVENNSSASRFSRNCSHQCRKKFSIKRKKLRYSIKNTVWRADHLNPYTAIWDYIQNIVRKFAFCALLTANHNIRLPFLGSIYAAKSLNRVSVVKTDFLEIILKSWEIFKIKKLGL